MVRLRADEHAEIVERAKLCRQGMSEYVRDALRRHNFYVDNYMLRPPPRPPVPRAEDLQPAGAEDLQPPARVTQDCPPDLLDSYAAVLERLSEATPKATFDTWIAGTFPVRVDFDGDGLGKVVTVAAPTAFAVAWLQGRMQGLFDVQLSAVLGREARARFVERADVRQAAAGGEA